MWKARPQSEVRLARHARLAEPRAEACDCGYSSIEISRTTSEWVWKPTTLLGALMLPMRLRAVKADGTEVCFTAVVRVDTPQEVEYYRNGGILPYVLRQLAV